ncbi:MAG: PIG-L family deacetylase [Fibrobacter sp.]|jgi:LmbE family N-acetylglucosaminyl deacetylase|nr:PIG-L family deacetylase [Fibrobacter sp.]
MKKSLELLESFCNKTHCGVSNTPSAILFCAHPDDEVLGSASLLHYLKDNLRIVTVTDGAPKKMDDAIAAGFCSREAYSKARFQEQLNAMYSAGITEAQVFQLGFIDQQASYQMGAICHKILEMLQKCKPEIVLTHAYEGGHPDHDTTAFAVWAAVEMLKKRQGDAPEVVEFACYHGNGSSEMVYYQFIDYPQIPVWSVQLDQEQIENKKKLIQYYTSQWKTLENFPLTVERFRRAPSYNFKRPPHPGVLLYEFYDWGMSASNWNQLAAETMHLLKLNEGS